MENNNESKITRVLFNQVSFILAISGVLISCVLFIAGPDAQMKQDIALIQKDIDTINTTIDKMATNELAHIQDSINDNTSKTEENVNRINEVCIKLERVLTILGE